MRGRKGPACALGAIVKKELENEVAAWTKEVEEYQRKADAKIAIDNKMGRALVDLGLMPGTEPDRALAAQGAAAKRAS